MKRIGKKETRTDVTYDYMVERDSIFDVLFRISNSKGLQVRTVMLDDLSSRNGEGTESTTWQDTIIKRLQLAATSQLTLLV